MSGTAQDLLDEYEQRKAELREFQNELLDTFVDIVFARTLSEVGERRGKDFDHWIITKVPFGNMSSWDFLLDEAARIQDGVRPSSTEAKLVTLILHDCTKRDVQLAIRRRLRERFDSSYGLGDGRNEVVRQRAMQDFFKVVRGQK